MIGSFFVYGSHKRENSTLITPLSSLWSVGAALVGIALYYSFSLYCFLPLTGLLAVCFLIHRHYRLVAWHAAACGLCAALGLWIDDHRLQAKRALLEQGRHTLHGLIIDHKAWSQGPQAAIVTLKLTHIDYAPTTGIFKFFIYQAPTISVGDYAAFFHVEAATEESATKTTSYALRDHLLGSCFTPTIKMRVLPQQTEQGVWIAWWHKQRAQLYATIENLMPPKVFTYFSALFFGNKERNDFLDIRAKFTRWGLTHYLARSGLHASLLVALWAGLLRFLPACVGIKAILLFTLLLAYDHLSWASISFNRALWLWFFYLGSWLAKTTATPLFGLAQLSLAILLFNPWQAGCLDFQLSFLLTMVLMIYSHYREQTFLLSSCIPKKK